MNSADELRAKALECGPGRGPDVRKIDTDLLRATLYECAAAIVESIERSKPKGKLTAEDIDALWKINAANLRGKRNE